MESITADTGELRRIARNVEGHASEYKRTYDMLLREVSTFTTTDWRGEDADAFRNKVEGFREDFEKMKNLMDEYANHLRQTAADYDNTRNEIIRKNQSLAE